MEIDWSWLGDEDSILRTAVSETVYRFEEGDNEDLEGDGNEDL